MKLTNLKLNLEPETTLFEEEANVLIAIILDILKKDRQDYKEGSFALYGTKKEDPEPKEILSFDFEDGPKENFLGRIDSANFAATELKIDGKRVKVSNATVNCSSLSGWNYVLLVPTTLGLFSADLATKKVDFFVYYAIAEALACMGKEDEVLRKGVDYMFGVEWEDEPGIFVLKDYIDELFEQQKLPEIKKWKEWHEKSADELVLFFGE